MSAYVQASRGPPIGLTAALTRPPRSANTTTNVRAVSFSLPSARPEHLIGLFPLSRQTPLSCDPIREHTLRSPFPVVFSKTVALSRPSLINHHVGKTHAVGGCIHQFPSARTPTGSASACCRRLQCPDGLTRRCGFLGKRLLIRA